MAARRPIEDRIADAEKRLARMTRTDTLTGLVGNGTALRSQWDDLILTRQHAIITAVMDHAVVAPGARPVPASSTPTGSFVEARWPVRPGGVSRRREGPV